MRSVLLLSMLGIHFLAGVVAGGQQAPPATLSRELRAHVLAEPFQPVTSLRGMPLGVREELQTLFGGQGLNIAEPGAEYQATDSIDRSRPLPSRRLVAAWCSYDHCLVYWERGGRVHQWRLALFHWTPNATRLEWGGSVPSGLSTIDDARGAIRSGASKGPADGW